MNAEIFTLRLIGFVGWSVIFILPLTLILPIFFHIARWFLKLELPVDSFFDRTRNSFQSLAASTIGFFELIFGEEVIFLPFAPTIVTATARLRIQGALAPSGISKEVQEAYEGISDHGPMLADQVQKCKICSSCGVKYEERSHYCPKCHSEKFTISWEPLKPNSNTSS